MPMSHFKMYKSDNYIKSQIALHGASKKEHNSGLDNYDLLFTQMAFTDKPVASDDADETLYRFLNFAEEDGQYLIVQAAFDVNWHAYQAHIFTNICQKMLIADDDLRVEIDKVIKEEKTPEELEYI